MPQKHLKLTSEPMNYLLLITAMNLKRDTIKTKSYGTVVTEDVLAYRLLKLAKLPDSQQQLAKATIDKLKNNNMKTQLKKKNIGLDVILQIS